MPTKITGGKSGQLEVSINKHSAIVHMSNATTMMARKAMNALIRIAKDTLKRHPDTKIFNVDIGVIKNLSGIRTGDNEALKDALRSLAHTKLEYNILNKDSEERTVCSFLARATVKG
jgi:hypothetical protein